MKKIFVILIAAILLALPLNATSGYIGTYHMDVDASGPGSDYGWYADYDTVIGGTSPSYEVFCVEEIAMNGRDVPYDFYTIDSDLVSTYGLGQTILDALEESTWYAHKFEAYGGIYSDDNNDRAKAAAQTAIWETMLYPLDSGDPTPLGQDLLNAFGGASDPHDYVDQWLLAVRDSDGNTGKITWNAGSQNYLVPRAAIPEPANMLLMGTGLLGLAALGRRKFFKK